MDISYKTNSLRNICEKGKEAVRALGDKGGKKLMQRMNELSSFECLADVPRFPPARCHQLHGNRKGQFSIDLEHPYRLIFEPAHNPMPRVADGGIDMKSVTKIKIIEIDDTHDGKSKKKRGR